MREKLHDAAELLKMLEMVFGQAGANNSPVNTASNPGTVKDRFPWAGVRLTLSQAQELIREHLSEPAIPPKAAVYKNGSPAREDEPRQPQPRRQPEQAKNQAAPQSFSPSTPRTSSSNSVEAPIRGTFNRVQLTEEPREDSVFKTEKSA
jgi:hypothetical protein